MGKLLAKNVAKARPGKYGDGQGLWLHVLPSGCRVYLYRYMLRGRARSMLLGDHDEGSFGLVEASCGSEVQINAQEGDG